MFTGLSHLGGQEKMKGERIIRGHRSMKSRTDWERVAAMTDDEIDCSEIPEADESFWANAELIMPENKVKLGVRFDKTVVEWFKQQGSGYQGRMNSVLKTYVEAQKSRNLKPKSRKKAS
jgi:uncharacterized protein (DUF4415 family)